MKIFKWTVGRASKLGLECLEESVSYIKSFYNDAKIILYYNYDILKDINRSIFDEIIDQREINNILFPYYSGPKWKLLPARHDINSWEISIDNDLIIHRPINKIEEFFKSNNKLLICEDIKRSYTEGLDNKIPDYIKYNTGLFGMYPGFDLNVHLEEMKKKYLNYWNDFYSEQSYLSIIFHKYDPIVISNKEISVSRGGHKNDLASGSHGAHFTGLNKKHFSYYLDYKLGRTTL